MSGIEVQLRNNLWRNWYGLKNPIIRENFPAVLLLVSKIFLRFSTRHQFSWIQRCGCRIAGSHYYQKFLCCVSSQIESHARQRNWHPAAFNQYFTVSLTGKSSVQRGRQSILRTRVLRSVINIAVQSDFQFALGVVKRRDCGRGVCWWRIWIRTEKVMAGITQSVSATADIPCVAV